MKVSELEGELLDIWVQRALDGKQYSADVEPYSSHWDCGGPLIERERIGVQPADNKLWVAHSKDRSRQSFGETPLIAAMRYFVASRFGDEVDPIKSR